MHTHTLWQIAQNCTRASEKAGRSGKTDTWTLFQSTTKIWEHPSLHKDCMKAHTFTKAVKNLRGGSGDQQSLNTVSRNISLQLLGKTECLEPGCSLRVYPWLWELLRWKRLETKHLWNTGDSHLYTGEANQEILLQQFASIKTKHGTQEDPVWDDGKHN